MTVLEMATYSEYVLALPWKILSFRLSHQHQLCEY